MSKLTQTQSRALDFIKERVARSGVAPTLREICDYMGYSAVGSAQDVVAALRKKGFLEEVTDQKARALILTTMARNIVTTSDYGDANTFVIPCLGTVPAGNPVEALESHIGTLRMSIAMLPKPLPRADELFALQATGESMVNAGILDGDWLVVRHQPEAPKGSIVVARIDEDVTVKRLMGDSRGFFLQPENDAFARIYAHEDPFEIVGRVLALQRAIT